MYSYLSLTTCITICLAAIVVRDSVMMGNTVNQLKVASSTTHVSINLFSITKHDLTVSSLITQRQQQCSPNEISVGGRCYRKSSYFDECDFSQQCNFVGGICDQHRCKCSYLDIYNDYQCVRDQMLPGTSNHLTLF
jgi:hypothetical protein